ncbi:MAG: hypothetical protein KC431_25475, partial [Myxococcales bacterium]|nr:hypothetical protein [Myxococcales bacterium]
MKLHRRLITIPLSTLALLAGTGTAWAGTITAQGNVTALTNVNELQGIVGTADFNVGPANTSMNLNQYAAQGATWHTGTLSSILPGVVQGGSASTPSYQSDFSYFPAPIAGGGTAAGFFTYFGGAVTFSDPITQVGLTAGRN